MSLIGKPEISVMNASGGGQENLAQNIQRDVQPAWCSVPQERSRGRRAPARRWIPPGEHPTRAEVRLIVVAGQVMHCPVTCDAE